MTALLLSLSLLARPAGALPASAVQASTQAVREAGVPSAASRTSEAALPRVSPRSAAERLKEKIRLDLLAVRRARYALRKAKLSGEAAAKAEASVLEAKRALKKDRLELEALHEGAAQKRGGRAR